MLSRFKIKCQSSEILFVPVWLEHLKIKRLAPRTIGCIRVTFRGRTAGHVVRDMRLIDQIDWHGVSSAHTFHQFDPIQDHAFA